jgi:hypothetical protein
VTAARAPLFALAVLLLASVPASAASEILVCHVVEVFPEGRIEHQLTIVPPEQRNQVLSTVDRDTYRTTKVLQTNVGVGTIEVKTKVGTAAPTARRFDFVQTRKPDGENSLIGFYVDFGGHVTVVRADTWAEGRPFYWYRAEFSKEGAYRSGSCQ